MVLSQLQLEKIWHNPHEAFSDHTLWVNLQLGSPHKPLRNFVHTAILDGSWIYGHFPSPLLHLPNLVKNWQNFLFLANRILAVCRLHRTFSLAKRRVRLFGSLTSLFPLPIRTYLPNKQVFIQDQKSIRTSVRNITILF